MEKELVVFWKYHSDLFDTLRSGEVEKINDNGMVSAKNYPGFLFKPALIIPKGKKSEELQQKIINAEEVFRRDLEIIKKNFKEKIDSFI